MSDGDVVAEPYLDSRNTIYDTETTTQILKTKWVKIVGVGSGKGYGGAMRKWWWYAEVYVGSGTKLDES